MRMTLAILLLLAACSRENAFTLPGKAWDSGCALPPVLDTGPQVLALGTVGPDQSNTKRLQLTNTGEATLGIAWIQPMAHGLGDDGAFRISILAGDGASEGAGDLAWVLPAEATLDIDVTFSPVHDGIHWGGIVIATGGAADAGDPTEPHMARETARGRVLFTGAGTGLGGTSPEVFLLGGIYPATSATEPGGTVRLLWETHDPAGRYGDAQRTYLRDQDDELHEISSWRSDWTAPAEEPARDAFARSATFQRTDADGNAVESSTPVFVWPSGRLETPICP